MQIFMSAIQKKNAFLLILRTVIDIFCYDFFFYYRFYAAIQTQIYFFSQIWKA